MPSAGASNESVYVADRCKYCGDSAADRCECYECFAGANIASVLGANLMPSPHGLQVDDCLQLHVLMNVLQAVCADNCLQV